MLFELAKQPALQDQLCAEIRTVLGDKVNPSWEDLQNIPLIRYCLKETLRLYPALDMNAREVKTDIVLNGYQVPAEVSALATIRPPVVCICPCMQTLVVSCNSLMSQSMDYFDEPDKFIPERWNKNKEDSIHPFASLPFGFGQRGCYGNVMACMHTTIAIMTSIIHRASSS